MNISSDIGNKVRISGFTTSTQHFTGILIGIIRQEKEKRNKIGKEIKLSLFANNLIIIFIEKL